MDVSTGNLHQVLPDTCGLFSASWSPDGSQIAYSVMGDEQTKGVYVLDVESRASRKLGGSTTLLEHVRSWSQDGSTILVDRCDCSGWGSDSMPESAQLVAIPVSSGNETVISSSSYYVLSPSGGAVAFDEDGLQVAQIPGGASQQAMADDPD